MWSSIMRESAIGAWFLRTKIDGVVGTKALLHDKKWDV